MRARFCVHIHIIQFAGVVFFAGASAVAYYLLRLVSRDLLGGFKWYRALAKQDSGVRMFELYMLSIVNAGLLTGYSACVRACVRVCVVVLLCVALHCVALRRVVGVCVLLRKAAGRQAGR